VATADELQSALTTAAANGEDDLIQVVQGTYEGNFGYASATEAFNLSVEGGYVPGCSSRMVDPANTVLDGSAAGTVLVLSTSQVDDFLLNVDGITLQNGSATTGNGGGLFVFTDGELTLTNSIMTGNTATESGAGVYVVPDTYPFSVAVALTNNTVSNNTGGGVYVLGDTVTLTNNTISSNDGRGVYASASNSGVTLTNNTISNNSSGGVSVDSYNSTVTLDYNTISNNTSVIGWRRRMEFRGHTDK
jgi:parallel beta-helix repeat protein